jgi:hypothetical protein
MEIDVGSLKLKCLRDAKSGAGQQSEQGGIGVRAEGVAWPQFCGGRDQLGELLVGEDMGLDSTMGAGDQPHVRHLAPSVDRREMASESPYD